MNVHNSGNSSPTPEHMATIAKYFSDSQIAEIEIRDDIVLVGDAKFQIRDNALALTSVPNIPYLLEFASKHESERSAWEVVAYLKVRHFNTPDAVIERARSGSLYDEDYYRRRGGGGPYLGYSNDEVLVAQFRMFASELNDRFRDGAFLDCGCATGLLVRELQALGRDASGFDISSWAIQNSAVPGLHVADGRKLEIFGDNQFSVLTSQDYLEHIHPDDHEAVFSEQLRVCRNGGHLVQFIPFYDTEAPYQLDAHLCNASREWWISRLESFPGMKIVQEPSHSQWDLENGMICRYVICQVNK